MFGLSSAFACVVSRPALGARLVTEPRESLLVAELHDASGFYASPMLAALLIAGSLGLSNFAASIAIGISGVDRGVRARLVFAFAVFEAGMPIIGLLIGRRLAHGLGGSAHLMGGLLLIAAGMQTTYSATRAASSEPVSSVATASMGRLLLLAAALSIDNLVVGFALGAHGAPLALSVAAIAAVSVGLSLIGLEIGTRLGVRVEHDSELIGGIVLIGVGVAILAKLI